MTSLIGSRVRAKSGVYVGSAPSTENPNYLYEIVAEYDQALQKDIKPRVYIDNPFCNHGCQMIPGTSKRKCGYWRVGIDVELAEPADPTEEMRPDPFFAKNSANAGANQGREPDASE